MYTFLGQFRADVRALELVWNDFVKHRRMGPDPSLVDYPPKGSPQMIAKLPDHSEIVLWPLETAPLPKIYRLWRAKEMLSAAPLKWLAKDRE